jgi:hypothetical protein
MLSDVTAGSKKSRGVKVAPVNYKLKWGCKYIAWLLTLYSPVDSRRETSAKY